MGWGSVPGSVYRQQSTHNPPQSCSAWALPSIPLPLGYRASTIALICGHLTLHATCQPKKRHAVSMGGLGVLATRPYPGMWSPILAGVMGHPTHAAHGVHGADAGRAFSAVLFNGRPTHSRFGDLCRLVYWPPGQEASSCGGADQLTKAVCFLQFKYATL